MKLASLVLAATLLTAAPLVAAAEPPAARPLTAPLVTPDAREASDALGKTVWSIYNGAPNYDDMAPDFRAAVKTQITDFTALIKELGLLSFADYQGIGPGGAQLFKGTFAHGKADVSIALNKAGKITALDINQTD